MGQGAITRKVVEMRAGVTGEEVMDIVRREVVNALMDWEGNTFICFPNQLVGNMLDSKHWVFVNRQVVRYWTAGQACMAWWD